MLCPQQTTTVLIQPGLIKVELIQHAKCYRIVVRLVRTLLKYPPTILNQVLKAASPLLTNHSTVVFTGLLMQATLNPILPTDYD